MLIVAFFILGLLVGPLLGIIVDRAVEREAPKPELRCQSCKTSLGPRSLVPVMHWFQRCPQDAGHRSWRYVATDVLAALSFAIAAGTFDWTWKLGPYVLFFAVIVVMAVIDAETHLLLNVLTWPAAIGGLFMVLVLSGMNGEEDAIWPAIIGALFFGGVLMLLHMVYPPGLGRGDVKMALSLGLFLGWITSDWPDAVILTMWVLMIASAGLGLFGLGRRWLQGIRAEVPMGPALAAATVLVLATPATFINF